MEENKILWNKILGEIEVEVSRANFLTLFKKTSLLSLEGDSLTIAAPSVMIIDLLQRRFYEVIKNSVDKHVGANSKIIFVPKILAPEEKAEKNGPLFDESEKSSTVIGHLPRVRPDYTFENLAVSGSNQLAFVSASTVAKNPGKTYNPLFIYGPTGVGKTHLMQAIANEVYQKNPNKKIIYITSEEFTNEVVDAIRSNSTNFMKKRFRNIDLLIIDDIQFIAGKEKVQEELFHTFNILVDNAAQIVLSSDRPPSEIKKVEKRLLSRFSGGLTVDIGTPDFELRTAILLIKAKKYGFDLPIEVAKAIAEKAQDARSLEGVLLRMVTEAETKGVSITSDLVQSVLKTTQTEDRGIFHPDDIINNICAYYKIKPTQIKSAKRDAFLVRARQVAMYILKKDLDLTFVEIGNILGGRDHTTVMHGVTKVEKMMVDGGFSKELLGIKNYEGGKLASY
ncbi:MAG: chromosomal replication initiator protein DnaA [Patescibacteria group bacterium]|nr:chromosomal replication initiator protein DnaA [Patescibacteria group bacterium]